MVTSSKQRDHGAAVGHVDVTQESYRIVVGRAFAARESNLFLPRDFFEKTVEEIQEQARQNLCASQELSGYVRKQDKGLDLSEWPAEVYEE